MGLTHTDPAGNSGSKKRRPFISLDPYTVRERDIYFGRDMEIREIFHSVFSNRLTIILGESGTGKTSLVQCGFLSEIKNKALFINIRSAINPVLHIENELIKKGMTEDKDIILKLKDAYYYIKKPIILFFDQFEEFFTQLSTSKREDLINLIYNLGSIKADIRTIISIREDYFGKLSEFSLLIDGFLDNLVQISKMNTTQAIDIIQKICQTCKIALEKKTAEEIINNISQDGKTVDLPLMQVVMDHLYKKSCIENNGHEIIHNESIVSIKSIIGNFLSQQIKCTRDPYNTIEVLKALVSVNGTKRLLSITEIENIINEKGMVQLSRDEISNIIHELIKLRVVIQDKDNEMIELLHDYLAERIFTELLSGEEKEVLRVKEKVRIMMEHNIDIDRGLLSIVDLMLQEGRLKLKSHASEDKKIKDHICKSREKLHRKYRQTQIAILCIILILSIFSLFMYNAYRRAVKEKFEAEVLQMEEAARAKSATRATFFLEMALRKNNLNEASNHLLSLKKDHPDHKDILEYETLLAKRYLEHSNFSQAIMHASNALLYNMDDPSALSIIQKAEKQLAEFNSIIISEETVPRYELNIRGISLAFRYIRPASFNMVFIKDAEKSIQSVNITKSFWIMEANVHQELFESIMGHNPSIRIKENYPVNGVNWHDAIAFCERLSVLTGLNWALPTDAEWAIVFHSGKDDISFHSPFYNIPELNSALPFENEWGLVFYRGFFEWCHDWLSGYKGNVGDPRGPNDGYLRTIRAIKSDGPEQTIRTGVSPYYRGNALGFRAVIRP